MTALTPIPCPVCGAPFKPYVVNRGRTIQTCSTSCGQKKRAAEGRHNRAMTGRKLSPETKRAVALASQRMWDGRSPEDREAWADRARLIAGTRTRSDKTHTRAKGGRRADLDNTYFRSAWEANYARWLNYRRDQARDVIGWRYEPRTFTFPVKRGTMSYTPDFQVVRPGGVIEWHEVKGWLTQQGATALKRFAKYYPDEVLVMIDADVYRSIAKQASRLIEGWE